MLNISNCQNRYNSPLKQPSRDQRTFKGSLEVYAEELKPVLKDATAEQRALIPTVGKYLRQTFAKLVSSTDKDHKMCAIFRFFTPEEVESIGKGKEISPFKPITNTVSPFETPADFDPNNMESLMSLKIEKPEVHLPKDSILGVQITSKDSPYSNKSNTFFSLDEKDGFEKLKKHVQTVVDSINVNRSIADDL